MGLVQARAKPLDELLLLLSLAAYQVSDMSDMYKGSFCLKMNTQSDIIFTDSADLRRGRFVARRRPRSSGRTSAIRHGLLRARRATGLAGTETRGAAG